MKGTSNSANSNTRLASAEAPLTCSGTKEQSQKRKKAKEVKRILETTISKI